jgi:Iap family predicted aminopeptidase
MINSLIKRLILAAAVMPVISTPDFAAKLSFVLVERDVVEGRLKSFSTNDTEREAIVKKMFVDAGCADHVSEAVVKHVKQPNVICVLPGTSDQVIFVGAHFDHVDAGDGVVDNWSGASLLSSLYQGLRTKPTRHTFVFISFSGEEKGELGSASYVDHMNKEEVARSEAMINLDTLGLGPTEVWLSHADPHLAGSLVALAKALTLPIGAVNVEEVGSSDSEQFARRKIPRITIHSLTQETLPILHSSRDKLSAMKLDDYYQSYRLLAAYLSYLDETLGQPIPTDAQTSPK